MAPEGVGIPWPRVPRRDLGITSTSPSKARAVLGSAPSPLPPAGAKSPGGASRKRTSSRGTSDCRSYNRS